MSERSSGRRSGSPKEIGLSTGVPAILTSLKKGARESPTLAWTANGGHDVSHVMEAIADVQSRLVRSPAMSYLKQRGVTPYTAMMYGLGHAVGAPYISRDTARAGYELGLITRGGTWLWQEGIVYAETRYRTRRC